jgi:phosphatidylglycerophosphatase A
MFKIHELILTFFYLGKAKKAPGTVGSFGAIVFWFLITKFFYNKNFALLWQNIFWLIFLSGIFLYGIFFIASYSKKFDEFDHKSIVLDEVLGQIIALQITFCFFYENYFFNPILIFSHLTFCFVFFRLFDITKPWIIGYCDRNFKNGFGVMFDDFLCGVFVATIGFALIFAIQFR